MSEFIMPSLGADMESAALVEWRFQPGDTVKRGDIIAEVETDKGVIEVEVFEDGMIESLLVEPGPDQIPVGTVMATLSANGDVPAMAAVSQEAKPEPKPEAAVAVATAPATAVAEDHHPMDHHAVTKQETRDKSPPKRIQASPSARKLARELGVDIAQVEGTGPHGVINRADIERAATVQPAQEKPEPTPVAPAVEAPQPKPKPAPAVEQTTKLSGMRRAIAAAMSRSNQDIPHYYLETQVDMTDTLAWLEAENVKRSAKDRILPAVLLIRAVAKALEAVPEFNGFWIEDEHRIEESINPGFAISLRQGGLIAPALLNADLMGMDELMNALRDLITRTRSNKLRGSEMTDATITISNLGDLGVEKVFGVIYPPQVALVGFGKITEQPWVEDGMLGIRKVLNVTLAADHRATDGAKGAQFLEAIKKQLKEPSL